MSQQTLVATVKFKSVKNCMVSVPSKWMPLFRSGSLHIIEMEYGENKRAFFSWSGEFTSESSHSIAVIEMSGIYALKLGIDEGEHVIVKLVRDLPTCNELQAEPVAVDDWEILELNATYIQNHLLDQVRIVWEGQILPVWTQSSICLFVRIGRISPGAIAAKLEEFTDVVVSPKASRKLTEDRATFANEVEYAAAAEEQSQTGWFDSSWNAITGMFFSKKSCEAKERRNTVSGQDSNHGFDRSFSAFQHRYRVHPYPECLEVESTLDVDVLSTNDTMATFRYLLQPTTVLVGVESVSNRDGHRLQKPFLASITKVTFKKDETEDVVDGKAVPEDSKKPKDPVDPSAFVRVVVVDGLFLDMFEEAVGKKNLGLCKLSELMVPGAILVPEALRRWLGLEVSSSVMLRAAADKPRVPRTITFGTVGHSVPSLTNEILEAEVRKFLHRMTSHGAPLVTSSSTIIELNWKGHRIDTVLMPSRDRGISPTDPERPHLVYLGPHLKLQPNTRDKIEVLTSYSDHASKLDTPTAAGFRVESLGGFEDYVEMGTSVLHFALRLGPLPASFATLTRPPSWGQSLLICGPKGVGKSTLAKCLCRQMWETAYKVHCNLIECVSLIGKRVESVVDVWKAAFSQGMRCAPSIVVLDDLDQLIGAPNGPELSSEQSTRLAHALLEVMNSLAPQVPLTVIATSTSRTTLCPLLVPSTGSRVFFKTLDVKPPDSTQRGEILNSLLLSKPGIHRDSIERVNLDVVCKKTESYVAWDLNSLVDKAIHECVSRAGPTTIRPQSCSEDIVLTDADFENALAQVTPIALRGLDLHVKGTMGWDDIGGLSDVKRSLVETLQWPTKYPALFRKCPLPMRGGILLYGPPGTGKTLLAMAVASECGMNFISVKGPELLSKYIGASEQAVRQLFMRAESAEPCVIFFDEFDSLAPRRGHDSTGVTDRVVNQLLTQMDGVDTVQGVYVLAATSRPDLIDPALLRPGRLDKCLYCPLPNEIERIQILKALTKPMALDADVDLGVLAAKCDFFSGADLKSLLYTAQLNSLHRTVPSRSTDNAADTERKEVVILNATVEDAAAEYEFPSAVITSSNGHEDDGCLGRTTPLRVSQMDLMTAAEGCRPSVTRSERARYQSIYGKFLKSRGFGSVDTERSDSAQRATMA